MNHPTNEMTIFSTNNILQDKFMQDLLHGIHNELDCNQSQSFDQIDANRPAADPIPFDKPGLALGKRADVLVVTTENQQNNAFMEVRNVLFREYADDTLGQVEQAYWPLPHKEKISTIMGHVEICVVLTPYIGSRDRDQVSRIHNEKLVEGNGTIFQVTDRYVAVKVNYCDSMDRLRDKHAEDPLQEISAMQVIGNAHPNLMGIIEVLFDGANLNVVMPYCGSGDLFELLQESQSTGRGFSEGVARYWFRQILAGIQHLHSRGICHRDLSPENIMIDTDNSLVIIDMGMAIRIPYTDPNNPGHVTDVTRGTTRRLIVQQGACGKLPYMSPEVYNSQHPFDGWAVDIWSAGTILFCMLTGNRSYQRPHDTDPQFYWMTHGLRQLITDWNVELSEEALHLMENMLQVDPSIRLTLDEVLRHPWMTLPDAPPPARKDAETLLFQVV